MYQKLREELKQFYWNNNNIGPAKAFAEKCFAILDERVEENMSVCRQKALQYQVIVEELHRKVKICI